MPRLRYLFLAIALLLAGCTSALPSAAQYPAPASSAAQPAVTGRGDQAYARRGAEAIRTAVRGLEPEAALERAAQGGLRIGDPEVVAACFGAPGKVPAMVCQFGPAATQPVAHTIVWHDGSAWRWQLYPQAPERLAAERRKMFAEVGCRLGCYSGISQVRQLVDEDRPELLVVINLGFTSAVKAEEVQVLRLLEDTWEVVWVPGAGDWNYGHAQVVLPARGANQLQVRGTSWLRLDTFAGYLVEPESGEHRHITERWVRKGSGYMLHDHVEEPSPYASLVRLVHYLSTGANEKAQTYLSTNISLEAARKALAQRPKRQGWTVTRWGDNGYLLDTEKAGNPTLGVRFARENDRWVLKEIWDPRQH